MRKEREDGPCGAGALVWRRRETGVDGALFIREGRSCEGLGGAEELREEAGPEDRKGEGGADNVIAVVILFELDREDFDDFFRLGKSESLLDEDLSHAFLLCKRGEVREEREIEQKLSRRKNNTTDDKAMKARNKWSDTGEIR